VTRHHGCLAWLPPRPLGGFPPGPTSS
jgi:hypothetical protein